MRVCRFDFFWAEQRLLDRKSTRLNSSHVEISYAVFCLIPPPPRSTLFPYTTLFRSGKPICVRMSVGGGGVVVVPVNRHRDLLVSAPFGATTPGFAGWARGLDAGLSLRFLLG